MDGGRCLKKNAERFGSFVKNSYICHELQKGHKSSEIAAWLWRKFYLVHEEVLHGVAAKTRTKE